ncbi:DUF4012 domain-containing protein [Microbacterium sp. LMI1-1-1.1]|uniref:DUF4012 domain-containing protein n=1 Tax=Microbacterium sp. LMI1-1-1.1 TaxID=3135223 RepID=UPI003465FBEC
MPAPAPSPSEPATRRHAAPTWADRRRRRRRRRLIVVGSATVLLVAAGAVGVAAWTLWGEARTARDHLTAAREAAGGIAAAVRDRDADAVRALTAQVSDQIRAADDIVQGPLWEAAANLPAVGPNIDAVQTMTGAATVIDDKALPAGVTLMTDLSTGSLSADGAGIDLTPLRHAKDAVPVISAAVDEAAAMMTGVDSTAVVPEIADAVTSFSTLIGDLRPTLDDLSASLPTLLDMAGADGPRSYLVLFQNNAEVRATGGNPAAMTLLRVDDGRLSLDEQADSSTFYAAGLVGRDIAEIPAETRALYERDTWQFPQNYTRTPDFPLTAHLFDAMWTEVTGSPVDGVVSLDPVALSHILEVTGPVTLDDGEVISSDNVVTVLLRDAYVRFGADGPAADAYFQRVVRSIFAVLSKGQWAPIPMIEALSRGVQEQRVMAWMRSEPEEQTIERAGLAGTFAADGRDLGVFVNDASYSKLEYYLASSVTVTCDAAAGTVQTSIALTNSAPRDGLPPYTEGHRNRSMGLPTSTMLLDVLFFSPRGQTVLATDPAQGDVPSWDRSGVDGGRNGRSVTVAVPAGGSTTATATSTYDPAAGIGSVRTTPGIANTPVSVSETCR